MLEFGKGSVEYLSQLANNVAEKTGIIERGLRQGALPRTADGKTRILELGTGGGESLERLRNLAQSQGAEVLAADILPGLVSSLKKRLGVEAVAADAAHLPFPDASLSAVNISAVLHEVSSYGTTIEDGSVVRGIHAVAAVFKELNRVLVPGGVAAYRDVLAPEGDLRTEKKVVYHRESWRLFAERFLSDFLASEPQFYKERRVVIEGAASGFSLIAPIGLQQELQRHYLMFRDYIRTVKGKEFGLSIEDAPWLNETEGLKSVTFLASEDVVPLIARHQFAVRERGGHKAYRGTSDNFDSLYDELIEKKFRDHPGQTSAFHEMFATWMRREGLEHYLYGNSRDLLRLSLETGQASGSGYVLFPATQNEVEVAPRYYYNRYLSQVADHPEKDGKQIIAFTKMPLEDARRSPLAEIN